MSTEQFSNNASSSLNGGISDTDTSLVVNSAALFPSGPQFRILIESEILLVTGVSGTTFTVTRGAEGTTPAAHTSGQPVRHVLTAAALVALAGGPAAVILSGTTTPRNVITNRPAQQSPIDNTKQGIVNLSSDTTGTSPGVTGNFSNLLGGDNNSIAADYSTILGGQSNSISIGADHSASGGFSCTSSAPYSFSFGFSCGATGTGSVAIGYGNTANGFGATAFGSNSMASALGAFAVGSNSQVDQPCGVATGASTHSFGYGHRAHSGAGVDGFQVIDTTHTATSTNGTPANFVDGDSSSLTLRPGHAYTIRARAVVGRSDAPGLPSKFEHELLIHVTGTVLSPTLVIDDDYVVRNVANGNTYTLAFSAPGAGSAALQATLTGTVGQTVSGTIHYDIVETQIAV